MPFNKQVFKTRSLTAVFFVLIMMSGLLFNKWLFILLFGFILGGCITEFVSIIRLITGPRYLVFLPLAIVYIVMPVLMMVDLGLSVEDGKILGYDPLFPCAIMFSVWINDTMAYIVGSLIGRTPFSKISPKKTWEGTLGGILLCIVVIMLLGSLPAARHIPMPQWAGLAAVVAIFGTLGDLLESKLKRMAGIKDSGSIMPGHGGFLDRFDSMLIAVPFAWIFIRFVMG